MEPTSQLSNIENANLTLFMFHVQIVFVGHRLSIAALWYEGLKQMLIIQIYEIFISCAAPCISAIFNLFYYIIIINEHFNLTISD
jgi:hypothetical protein